MDWIERLNGAIGYIEEHLTEKIEYEELAKLLCCSTYQFQRMFSFMNDVSLSEYIRRRKLSLAAADIQNGTLTRMMAMKKDIFDDLLGITVCGDHKDWRYYIAVAASSDITPGFEETVMPASKWAVFSGRGTNLSLQELERRVVTQWLPSSGFLYGDAPDIERYLQADPQDAVYEYWLSIRSKKE